MSCQGALDSSPNSYTLIPCRLCLLRAAPFGHPWSMLASSFPSSVALCSLKGTGP
jgi:hypothetical protein